MESKYVKINKNVSVQFNNEPVYIECHGKVILLKIETLQNIIDTVNLVKPFEFKDSIEQLRNT